MAGILRLERAVGVVDGVNDAFSTPTPYESGSLQVFRNGVLQDKATYVVEVDPAAGTFRVCVPPLPPDPNVSVAAGDPGDVLDVAYRDAVIVTGGGADGGVPDLRSAAELVPVVCAVEEVVPNAYASDDVADVCPPVVGAGDTAPKTTTAVDVRPKIASAREV